MRKAAENVRRLFPNSEQEDASGQPNENDDTEAFEDFSCPLVTEVNMETGEVVTREDEEEPEVEKELIAGVIAHAQSISAAGAGDSEVAAGAGRAADAAGIIDFPVYVCNTV